MINGIRETRVKEDKRKRGKSMHRTVKKEEKKPVTRSFKEIDPFYILDTDYAGIMLVGTDEIFVRLPKYREFWISNYGRGLTLVAGKYQYVKSHKFGGELCYELELILNEKEPEYVVPKTIPVDQLVVDTFIEVPEREKRMKIWHSGNDVEDFYYQNLYPVTKMEYRAVRSFFSEHGYDTEADILHIMNEEREFLPTICGRGYWGEKDVDIVSDSYIRWSNMMRRCYSENFQKRKPTYIGCSVCEEWWNYSNFKKWLQANWYQVGKDTMCIDKDILVKGNKIYSPETCVICPECINLLFVKNDSCRGKFPIGVYEVEGKYVAQVNYCNKTKQLGTFETPEEAFLEYKKYKEKFIKDMAEKYKEKGIPDKLYNAMMNWTVEIGD